MADPIPTAPTGDTRGDGLPRLVRMSDVARMLSVGTSTAYFLIDSGRLRSKRLGRMHRVPLEDVLRLMETGYAAPRHTRCKGHTASGSRCRRAPWGESAYCAQHEPEENGATKVKAVRRRKAG